MTAAAAGWGPTVVAFVAVRVYLLVVAAHYGLDGLRSEAWERWDSFQYLSIANVGYTLGASDGHNSHAPVGTAIGNAGWAPAYPLLIRGAQRAGVPQGAAALALSEAFALLMLRAIDGLLPTGLPWGRRMGGVLLAAFFPGFVYVHAVFPISMAAVLLAISVRLTAGGRWTLGGLTGGAAAFSYTSGYLVGPVMGVWAVLSAGSRGATPTGPLRRAVRMLGPASLPVAGLGVILAMQRARLGRWDGLFLVQRAHGLGYTNPLAMLVRYLRFVTTLDRSQVAILAVLVPWMVVATVIRWRRRPAIEQLLALAAAAYWASPLTLGSGLSPWRAMAMLTPFVPPLLARRLPALALWGLLAVFLVVGWAMCARFFDWTAV